MQLAGEPSHVVAQFIVDELKNIIRLNGVKYTTSFPYHWRTNGLAECFVQSFKQAIKEGQQDSSNEHSSK